MTRAGSVPEFGPGATARDRRLRDDFERAYRQWNRSSALDTDPVVVVASFDDPAERELAGLIAASLAYGRVAHIQSSVARVLDALDGCPARFVRERSAAAVTGRVAGIRHRFSSGGDIGALLVGAKRIIERGGRLEAAFDRRPDEPTVVPAAVRFVDAFEIPAAAGRFRLLASPRDGSACKRLFMFLRWMVRRDAIDVGVWTSSDRPALVVPIDTHMHRIARRLRLTRRTATDLRTALEVTERFRRIRPDDPARYDFALTRLGMSGAGDAIGRLGRARVTDDSGR